MRRVIKVLAVSALVAMLLVASVSPAFAKVVRGGVLLKATTPCDLTSQVAQNDPGAPLQIFLPREGRTPGCWVLLPPSAPQE